MYQGLVQALRSRKRLMPVAMVVICGKSTKKGS